jgi:cystathionine beta-lyase/cystathionine gamma-synthase
MTAAPFDAWLTCRGIRTLGVRVERAAATAALLTARLGAHGRVHAVRYPGQGAILSFDLADGEAAARAVRAFRLIALTPSLGGVTTSVSHAATSSHRGLSPEARRAMGIGDGLLRLSVGVEAADDIWTDLEQGISA